MWLGVSANNHLLRFILIFQKVMENSLKISDFRSKYPLFFDNSKKLVQKVKNMNDLSDLINEMRSMERRHNEEDVRLKIRLGSALLELKSKNMLEFHEVVRKSGLSMLACVEIMQIARMNPPQECHWLGFENLLKIADALPKGKNISVFLKPFETESPDNATKAVILNHILKCNGINGVSENAVALFAKAGVASLLTKANIDRLKLSKNQTKTLQSIFANQTQNVALSKKAVLNPRLQQNIEKMNFDIQSILSQDENIEFIDNSGLIDLICSLQMLCDKVDGENDGDYKLGNEINKKEFEEFVDNLIKEQK